MLKLDKLSKGELACDWSISSASRQTPRVLTVPTVPRKPYTVHTPSLATCLSVSASLRNSDLKDAAWKSIPPFTIYTCGNEVGSVRLMNIEI